MGEKFQGQGLRTRLTEKIVDLVFQEIPIRKLYAYVHDKKISRLVNFWSESDSRRKVCYESIIEHCCAHAAIFVRR